VHSVILQRRFTLKGISPQGGAGQKHLRCQPYLLPPGDATGNGAFMVWTRFFHIPLAAVLLAVYDKYVWKNVAGTRWCMEKTFVATGINLSNLEEAFAGSEDVLSQMLSLFQVQAAERVQQLSAHLADWDEMGARTVLHSLVNIAGAVRAYGMSDLAKSVGDAVKRGDRAKAQAIARCLVSESVFVLAQVRLLLEAAQQGPRELWTADLSPETEAGTSPDTLLDPLHDA